MERYRASITNALRFCCWMVFCLFPRRGKRTGAVLRSGPLRPRPFGRTAPGYFWCNSAGERLTRHAMQKHKLADRLRAFDPALSEAENCRANGLWRIYDCGHLKLELAVGK